MTVDEIDARTTALGARVEAYEARLQRVESNQQLILEKLTYIQNLVNLQQWNAYGHGQQYPYTPTVSATQPPPPFYAPFNPPAPTPSSQPLGTHTPLAPTTPILPAPTTPTTPTLPAPTTPTLPTPTTANNPMQQGVPRKPLPVKAASNALPSTEINGSKLIPVSTVLLKYPKLKGESKAGTLAVKLAREALFGDAVLAKCTPFGNREQPALPTNELNRLKEELFQLFPQYLPNPAEFESLWRVCTEAVGQVCKRLRAQKPPPITV